MRDVNCQLPAASCKTAATTRVDGFHRDLKKLAVHHVEAATAITAGTNK